MPDSRSSPTVAAATILPGRRDANGDRSRDPATAGGIPTRGGGTAAEDRSPAVRNGLELLQAWRDLFDSDEEMEEFGQYIQQMREKERARYRD